MTKSEMTKCVNGIVRYKTDLYDITFYDSTNGMAFYVRAVPYDELLKIALKYIHILQMEVYGVFQNTKYKSDILIILSNY